MAKGVVTIEDKTYKFDTVTVEIGKVAELTSLYFEMPNEIIANVEVSKEFPDSKKIGTIPFQIGARFSADANAGVKLDILFYERYDTTSLTVEHL